MISCQRARAHDVEIATDMLGELDFDGLRTRGPSNDAPLLNGCHFTLHIVCR